MKNIQGTKTCIKDVYLFGGERSFTKGQSYIVSKDEYFLADDKSVESDIGYVMFDDYNSSFYFSENSPIIMEYFK